MYGSLNRTLLNTGAIGLIAVLKFLWFKQPLGIQYRHLVDRIDGEPVWP